MVEEKNAVIESTRLTIDDHGILSAWLILDYGGCGQGFGGYCLYTPKDREHTAKSRNYAGHFIWRVLEIASVGEWSKLRGKTIRVRAEHGEVHAIGHIIKDDWFNPSVDLKELDTLNLTSLMMGTRKY
jgi:hypothetical protein